MGTALLLVVCAAFIAVNGRNDGAPLTAIALQSRGDKGWVALLYLWLLLPVVPLLGFWGVAESLYTMMGLQEDKPLQAAAMLLAVLVTVGFSNLINIPTSITLALVGALAGSAWANGGTAPANLLLRVILLGLAAPLVAGLLAYGLSKIPLSDTNATRTTLLTYRYLSLPLLIVAYAANDGQKMAFVIALAVGASIQEVAAMPIALFLGSSIFILGVWFGLRPSGRYIRHGITAVRPLDLLWVETGSSLAVLGGSAMGIPLSMTQSVTGGVAGVGISRSTKAIHWQNVGRIGIAWLWTLPVASLLSYLMVLST